MRITDDTLRAAKLQNVLDVKELPDDVRKDLDDLGQAEKTGAPNQKELDKALRNKLREEFTALKNAEH